MALIVQGNKTIAHAVVRVRIAKSLIITKLLGVYLDRAQANKEYRTLMQTNRGKRETYAIERTSVITPGPALVDDVTGQPVTITIAKVDAPRVVTVPPDPEELNDNRAAWGETAVKAFMTETGVDAPDAVADLIADLHHLCDRQPDTYGTFDTALDRATMHYEAETEDDNGEDHDEADARTLQIDMLRENRDTFNQHQPEGGPAWETEHPDLAKELAELTGTETVIDHAAIVTAIRDVMDGQEWNADTADAIARIFNGHGVPLRDVGGDDGYGDNQPETCDECGAVVNPDAKSLINASHADSCSLYPANISEPDGK